MFLFLFKSKYRRKRTATAAAEDLALLALVLVSVLASVTYCELESCKDVECVNGVCFNGTCLCHDGWQGKLCQYCGGKVKWVMECTWRASHWDAEVLWFNKTSQFVPVMWVNLSWFIEPYIVINNKSVLIVSQYRSISVFLWYILNFWF